MELSDEQKELQEKLKDMSPEELQQFQKQQCIFCQIIEGKVQSRKVYEDDLVMAILDINPANPGHLLLLPKEHYMVVPQVPPDVLGHIFRIARNLSHVLLKSLGVEGTNILVANGVAAGQRAQHMIVHVIPRKENDGVDFELPRKDIDDSQMTDIQRRIAEVLSKSTGRPSPQMISEPEPEEEPEPEPEEEKEEQPDQEEKLEEEKKEQAEEEPETEKDKPESGQEELPEEKPDQEEQPEPESEEPEEEKDDLKADRADLDRISKILMGK